MGGSGKATGHPNTRGRELADHFPEGGILAPHGIHIGHAQRLKWHNQALAEAASGFCGTHGTSPKMLKIFKLTGF
jgi:hypothetical protein